VNTNPRTRTVLHIAPSLGRNGMLGGGMRVPVELVKLLNRRAGWTGKLCVLGVEDPDWRQYGLGEKPFFLGVREHSGHPLDFPRCAARLRKIMLMHEFDLVHSHLRLSDFVAGVVLRFSKTPHIVHLHDTRSWMSSRRTTDRARRWWYRRLLDRPTTRFVACAEAVRKHAITCLRLDPDRVEVVLNGIDISVFVPGPREKNSPDPLIFGTSGRFQPEKGFDILIRALAAVRKKGFHAKLRIAGGGTRLERYRELAAREDVACDVEFCGRLNDMPSFYRTLDVYVQPATGAEGLPLSILEAMASGLPIIATDVAGASEALRHEREGLLLSPGAVDELAGALSRMITDRDLRHSMGKAGRQRIEEHFTIDVMGEGVLNTYRRLLEQTG